MKVALVIGHNPDDQGTFAGSPINSFELPYNKEVANKIVEMNSNDPSSPLSFKIFDRVFLDSYKDEVDKVYGEVDAWGADISVELHFNAVDYEAALGTETLSSGTVRSLKLATIYQEAMLDALGTKDRGVKIRNKSIKDRGWRSLVTGLCPAIIVEPFFASNPGDMEKIVAFGKDNLAKLYFEAAAKYFDVSVNIIDEDEDGDDFLANVDLLTQNKNKEEFLQDTHNVACFNELVTAINRRTEINAHGEQFNTLSLEDIYGVCYAEMGLKANGDIDINHEHSLGEKGLLPLPSNLHFWIGTIPSYTGNAMKAERNIKEFLLYLASIKNKDVFRDFDGGTLYEDLFNLSFVDDPLKEMKILAAVVHGYFLPQNFSSGAPLPYTDIAQEVVNATAGSHQGLIDLLANHGYHHAVNNPEIISNRLGNLEQGISLIT